MPCYTIRETPVTFEKVAYRPGHMSLLLDALKAMGYQVQANVPTIKLRSHQPSGQAMKIWPVGAVATTQNTILYKDGKLQIPSTSSFKVEALKEAYSRAAVKLHAARNGWLLREVGQNQFEAIRR